MSRDSRFHLLFDCDIREAAEWYDRRSIGLGKVFADNVNERISDVIANPERFARTPAGDRYVRVKGFPYIVLFDVSDDVIRFIAVLHTARAENKWRERRTDL